MRSFIQKNLIIFIFLTGIHIHPIHANEKCLRNKILFGIQRYFSEGFTSRFKHRFIFKKVDESEEAKYRLAHFFYQYQPPENTRWYHRVYGVIQYPSRKLSQTFFKTEYDFTPFMGASYVSINFPLSLGSGYFLKDRYELTLPAMFATSYAFYTYIEEPMWKKVYELKVKYEITKNRAFWGKFIEYDFRFQGLKKKYSAPYPDDAIIEAYFYYQAIDDYNNFISTIYPTLSKAEQHEFLLYYPFFSYLEPLIQNGLPPNEEKYKYLSHYSQGITEQQIDKLFEYNVNLYRTYDILGNLVAFPDETIQSQDIETQKILKNISENNFAKFLFTLHEKGELSQEELVFRLQEDYFWINQLREWNVFGVQKRIKDDSGKYSEKVITLELIRNQTIFELNEQKIKK